MLRTLIIITLFIMLLNSCSSPAYRHEGFMLKYNLDKHDTVFVVSSVSCGGCLRGFFAGKKILPNSILVFDTTARDEYILSLINHKHMHVSQKILDKEFDYFGNILIIFRSHDSFKVRQYPEY